LCARKLPSLSSSLVVQTPKDDPALHQGRIRTVLHVDGQWASHVYVSIKVNKFSPIHKVLLDSLQTARQIEPALHDLFGLDDEENNSGKHLNLHISLSRPIFLRTHQRDDLKRVVKSLAEKCSGFKVSFTTFSILTNDEKTRTFLALDVGSGHHELKFLSDGLTSFIATLRQKEYYTDPRFHASIAWALIGAQTPNGADDSYFQTISQLPTSLSAALNEQYAPTLSSPSCGAFDVQDVCLKIGKDVFTWMLK